MKLKALSPEVGLLLWIVDEGYEKKGWHGPNLRGSIRGLDARQASWRPADGRHNIWEIVVHCAYWKYAVRRRILEEKRGSFPIKGSNWFVRPTAITPEAWRKDVALLEDTHRRLQSVIAGLTPGDLRRTPRGSRVNTAALISGIAAHDVYHAGQIQLLKRLRESRDR
jgi:uncharacterized damage-inducible protein DinB